MVHGWAGSVLRVDLSRGKVIKQRLNVGQARLYLGGRGLNVMRLYDEVGTEIKALDPENCLIFGPGLLTGTLAPSSGRMSVNAKSPLTGLLGDSSVGGHFGSKLKFAGYDQVVIRGRAKKPVYLWIDGSDVAIKDAAHIWGKDAWQTHDVIAEEVAKDDVSIGAIGPAGENLVKFACIVFDKFRAAGRTGMGTVMGSKNLKAVAVHGDKDISIADPEGLEKASKEAISKLLNSASVRTFSKYGTSQYVPGSAEWGLLLTYNGQGLEFNTVGNLSPENLVKNHVLKSTACYNCPVHCGHVYRVKTGPYSGTCGAKVDFGTIVAFGPNLGVDSYDFILWANNFCYQMGIDVMSCGSVIGWAIECSQRGILNEKDTDGIELKWGNQEGIAKLMRLITKKQGFGATLAEGVKKASEILGKGSEKYASHVKGHEYTYDIRGSKGGCLACSVSSIGGTHTHGYPPLEYGGIAPGKLGDMVIANVAPDPRAYAGKAGLVIWTEHVFALASSLGICKFVNVASGLDLLNESDLSALVSYATGCRMSKHDLLKVGERVVNLERVFVVREGITVKDDFPPRRQIEEAIPEGVAKGEKIDLDKYTEMLMEYYKLRGWDTHGIPSKKKLKELGVEKTAPRVNQRR